MQLTVTNSPFSQEQSENLNKLLPVLNTEQRLWLSGYLTAPVAEGEIQPAQPQTQTQAPVQQSTREVTVLYGSETGNAENLAKDLVKKLEEKDLKTSIKALDDFKIRNLKKVEDLFIITATHGEGDPPDNAIAFHEALFSRKAPKLKDVRFSVLSLGDESYEFFCEAGKVFDKRLEELGGERIHPRVDCDLDFDDPAAEWASGILEKLDESTGGVAQETQAQADAVGGTVQYSRSNPFQAEVLENINLNGSGSNKETHHVELLLEGSNLEFEAGDSLGVYPQNEKQLVADIIEAIGFDPEESVPVNKDGEIRSLQEALLSKFEVSRITKSFLTKAKDVFNNAELEALVNDESADLLAYVDGKTVLDVVKEFPPQDVKAGDWVKILRKLPARQYSIASSFKANPDEVHLTIVKDTFAVGEEQQNGVCSTHVIENVEPGDKLPIYVHRNPNFKFPFEEDKKVIMIGPGTGVAPFRSYLEEREELGLEGNTWLFFGDQHFSSDFLYQVDWQQWVSEGVLEKMDIAFSRDTEEKVYVQHQIDARGQEFFKWLEDGASIYICGDEKRMAKDVHDTIIKVIEREGGYSTEDAESYLQQLKQDKKYQRDVY